MGKITQHPIIKTRKNHLLQQIITALVLAIGTGLFIIFTNFPAATLECREIPCKAPTNHSKELVKKSHPLPPTLAKWQDKSNSGDYFEQIQPTKSGYLIWSKFPIKVKIATPTGINEKQAQTWVNSVSQAVQEWNNYLPLEIVEKSEIADITIYRKAPPLQIDPNNKIPRARSALTTYEIFTNNNTLSHRFTILLSPTQTGEYLPAAARHELGHALGIWGHSPLQTDALYFSQVRKPATISARDVNTLKRIYQQPTNLGW
ncbi:MAG TPA: peptidase [Nostocaceae cyanobacterium]|nr:peptidase [Nostocaceae cyanobacterium]